MYNELLVPFFVTAMLIRVDKLPINEAAAITQRMAALIEALVVNLGASSNDDELPQTSFNDDEFETLLNELVQFKGSDISPLMSRW